MHLHDVGFMGLARSGKDAASDILQKLGWTKIAFASPIKEIAVRDFKWNKEKDEKGRKLLQSIGMAGRNYNPKIWIDKARNEMGSQGFKYVWTDCRFQNEIDFLRNERKAIIIRIVRPGIVAGEHISESGQSALSADFEVINDGTVNDLHKKIINVLLER